LLIIEARIESINVDLNDNTEIATITFKESLRVGVGRLHIKYTGIINNKLKGFYRSKYTNRAGAESYAAVTQFEVRFVFCSL
jgi:puromycin-sensitive aminopeptidase